MKRETLPFDADLAWLERAAKGAREVLADYRTPAQLYPIDTESDPFVPDTVTPRAAHHLNLDFLRRIDCVACGRDDKPLEREWSGNRLLCPTCRERAEDRAQEFRSEESYLRQREAR